ncbi:MAG: hypothetical protein EBR46_04640, partial [Betaproteobacteria bacterium]|nr:hypothetical protein [Betaproteobacteria bacterium]
MALVGWALGGVWAAASPLVAASPIEAAFKVVAFHDVVDHPGEADPDAVTTDRLVAFFDHLRGDVVAGDCHLANTAINEQTGTKPVHPLQMIARAYGIP